MSVHYFLLKFISEDLDNKATSLLDIRAALGIDSNSRLSAAIQNFVRNKLLSTKKLSGTNYYFVTKAGIEIVRKAKDNLLSKDAYIDFLLEEPAPRKSKAISTGPLPSATQNILSALSDFTSQHQELEGIARGMMHKLADHFGAQIIYPEQQE